MYTFLRTSVWPIAAGLLTAFIIMMVFEYINSFFYPLPEGLDSNDTAAVHAFTASLPWTAYILVFLGWAFGSFKAGCVTTYLASERTYRRSLVVGLILIALGIANHFMIGQDVLVTLLSLPVFMIGTFLGHRYLRHVHDGRARTS